MGKLLILSPKFAFDQFWFEFYENMHNFLSDEFQKVIFNKIKKAKSGGVKKHVIQISPWEYVLQRLFFFSWN